MADDVVLPGTGDRVSTDERSIGGQTVKVQRVEDIGSSAVTVGRASVTTTSGEAVAARETRKRIVLLNLGTDTIDVGPSGVSSGSGFPLAPGASVTLHTAAALHADAASGTQSLAYVEEHD